MKTISVPYPPKNCRITFRDPFPRIEWYNGRRKYYIKAVIDNRPAGQLRMGSTQQLNVIDRLLVQDKKILNTVIECQKGQFYVISHSPQLDFFGEIK